MHRRRNALGLAVLLAVAAVSFGALSTGGSGPSTPATSKSQGKAHLVFAAKFADGPRGYADAIHPERITVVDDPVLGAARKVLKFTVFNGDTGPTENPRAQLETPSDFKEGDDRYVGVSYNFGTNFPTMLPPRAWVVLGSDAFGPPYAGAAPVSLRVQNSVQGDGSEIRWQRNGVYDYDIPWVGPKIADLRNRWVDIVVRNKLSRNPKIGFVEIWMNTGSGWVQQKLFGRKRLYMQTYDRTNNGGPNNSRIALYYRKDIPGPLTMYHGAHKVATAGKGAFALVAPHSYG